MCAKPYSRLANVYDAIMSDIDYDSWGEFILRIATERGWQGGRCLDLGCGTGNATFPIYARGFEVIGVDASKAMLRVAREKLPPVDFAEANFEEFKFKEPFSLIYSVFDALNNLLSYEAFLAALNNVYAHLEPRGFFIFDVNTTLGLKELWEAGRAEGWVNDIYYRWEHSFDESTGLARVEAYCESEKEAFTEVHYERPYDQADLTELLTKARFKQLEFLDYPSAKPALEDAARLWVCAQKG